MHVRNFYDPEKRDTFVNVSARLDSIFLLGQVVSLGYLVMILLDCCYMHRAFKDEAITDRTVIF